MPKKLPSITIVRDTREKENQGWFWNPEEKLPGKIQILGTIEKGLESADYSLLGYEDQILIERKAGFCELFGNFGSRDHKDRFEREMERIRNVPYKYLIVETNASNDIFGLSVPQIFRGPPVSAISKYLFELQMEYGIIPVFAGDAGKKIARHIFETFIKRIS